MGPSNTSGYDLNGNIKYLQRYGKKDATLYGLMDDLTYTYTGNQLTRVDDVIAKNTLEDGFKENTKSANEYGVYDANGNITKDDNKGITAITYNHLNLPVQVNKGATDYMIYTYDATSRKLAQQVFGTTPKTTDYIGEFVYENNTIAFISHEEGRIVADNSVGAPRPWEYQYFLKDHLGNVRTTFSEKKTTSEFKATLEDATQTDEQSTFKGYKNRSPLSIFNHTTIGTYSQVLNGGNNNQVGLAKSFAVNPGDVIDMEVYAKYEAATTTSNSLSTLFNALAGTFALNASGGTGIDGQQAYNSFNSLFAAGPIITSSNWESSAAPKAYLNYILFDQNFALVDFGFDQIGTNGEQVGVSPVTAADYLNLHVKVKQKGYLYIYLSNENPVIQNVYFDDLKIVYNSGVEQISNYYAFGLAQASNSFEKPNLVNQPIGYNGKELQDELNIGWLDYGARMYMSEIGRWGVIDPLANKYYKFSPYCFAANSPIAITDPNGKELDYSQLSKEDKKTFKQMFRELRKSGETGKAIVKFLKSKDSGRIVLTANDDSSNPGTFTSNSRKSLYNYDSESGDRLGKSSETERVHLETSDLFKNPNEVGGILNVNLPTLKAIKDNPYSAFVEEAVHAAIFGFEAKKSGSNLDIHLPAGNDEFTAKAIVGQIEKESKREIVDYSNDKPARVYGVQAFQNRSTDGFYENLVNWQSQQSGTYKRRYSDQTIPSLFKKLVSN